jgi:hypothetical protein
MPRKHSMEKRLAVVLAGLPCGFSEGGMLKVRERDVQPGLGLHVPFHHQDPLEVGASGIALGFAVSSAMEVTH